MVCLVRIPPFGNLPICSRCRLRLGEDARKREGDELCSDVLLSFWRSHRRPFAVNPDAFGTPHEGANVQSAPHCRAARVCCVPSLSSSCISCDLCSYVVAATTRSSIGSMGLNIKIQSQKSPAFLEDRVEAFLESFRATLAELSSDKLEDEKGSLVLKLLEKPKNLAEESSRFWGGISWGYYDFLLGMCFFRFRYPSQRLTIPFKTRCLRLRSGHFNLMIFSLHTMRIFGLDRRRGGNWPCTLFLRKLRTKLVSRQR